MWRRLDRKIARILNRVFTVLMACIVLIVIGFFVQVPFFSKLDQWIIRRLKINYTLIGFILIGIFIVMIAIKGYGLIRKYRSNIKTYDGFHGFKFEDVIARLFSLEGFIAEGTKKSRDFGADVVLVRNGQRGVVQVKRSDAPIGQTAIREVVAAKPIYNAQFAMVVTNNYFTDSAKILAKANQVTLWDRDILIRMLSKHNMRKDEMLKG